MRLPVIKMPAKKAVVAALTVLLLIVVTPGVAFKYSGMPTFLEGWALIWAAVAAFFCCSLFFAANAEVWLRKYYFLPLILAVVMAGQYAAGIDWNFQGEYSVHLAHKLASLALLEGKLYYPYSFAFGLDPDYQVFNGAVFTNWNYGVPLLQAPFHALARVWGMGGGALPVFPDRIIFLVYYTAVAAYVCHALNLYASRRGYADSLVRYAVVAVAVVCVFTVTLYWLVSYRFLVYEETVSYLILSELAAVTSLFSWTVTKQNGYLVALGITAGMGTLIRPTGVIYDAVFALALFERKDLRPAARYLLALLPFALVFFGLNAYKSGSPIGVGTNNTNPGWDGDYVQVRFGSPCTQNLPGYLNVAYILFSNLFVAPTANTTFLNVCGFRLENAPRLAPPYIGWSLSIILLCYLIWIWRSKAFNLAAFAPLLGLAAMFVLYTTFLGGGFAYRYAGDFVVFYVWMAAVMLAALNRELKPLWWGLGAVLALAFVSYKLAVVVTPQLPTVMKTASPEAGSGLWGVGPLDHWGQYDTQPLPASRTCQDAPLALPHDKFGWHTDCSVENFVNIFMALPKRTDDGNHYTMQFDLRGFMPDKIYINGAYYRAQSGNAVQFTASHRLITPNILVSFLWTKTADSKATSLRAVSIR